jgi:hypothetical protein
VRGLQGINVENFTKGVLMSPRNSLTDDELLQFLREHPILRDSVEEMIEISSGPDKLDVDFDDAEDAVIEHIHRTGKEMLRCWAQKASDSATNEELRCGGRCHEKKRS